MKRTGFLIGTIAAAALLLPDSSALAQANSGHPGNEGCWCGFQTGIVRNYVVRGTSSTAAQKDAAADMIREWNRYVSLFNVSVDSSSSLGSQNGVNEVNVFISNEESKARYGIELDANLFGVAVMFPEAGFGAFNQCKDFRPDGCSAFTETDVVVNAGFPSGWTGDWYAPGNDTQGGVALVQATVLHEVGHTLGLHHVFDVASGAGYGNSLSTMNYLNDDVGKFVTRMDSKTIRAEYPAAARSLVDVAIFPFAYGNAKYKQVYAALSKTSVLPGESFTLSNWLIQNVGSQATGALRVTFYLFPAGSRAYPQPGDLAVGNVDFAAGADVDAEQVMNGTPLVVPAGAAAGDYWLGAIATVNGQEDSTYQPGKPSNNRFVVGHKPVAVRVLQGSGGTTPLSADFQSAPAPAQAGQTVSFQDLSRGNPTGWLWDFGDPASGSANSSTARNPDHVYQQAGTYTVRLTVSASGTASNSATRQVAVTPKPGTGTSSSALLVPIVLDLPGRFSSELTLTNSGNTTATLRLRYTAAPVFGGAGSGTVSRTLGPGQQTVIPDAIGYLRQNGLAIPTGSNQGGSLRVEFEGLSNSAAGYAAARTTAPISGIGRAGLSYPGVDVTKAFTEPVAIFGLRQNASDRSNLALVNASTTSPVTLTVYVVRGDGSASIVFNPITLQPGQWSQYDGILTQADPALTEGWILIEPSSGNVPYLAYGVFNDNGTNDGSFVPAIPDSQVDALLGVPVIVEVGSRFASELMLTNLSDKPAQAYFEFVESLSTPGGASTGVFYVDLAPLEQVLIPNVVDELRSAGASIGPRGGSYAGALTVLFSAANGLTPGLAGVRTSSPSSTGPGRYGLFYAGDPFTNSARDAWIYGLQQNASTRTNLAVVNAAVTNTPITIRLEIYSGTTGALVSRQTLATLQPGQWRQYDSVLAQFAPGLENGYARLTVVDGDDSFFAYSVLNDGPAPNTGTSDGSYVPMVVSR
ncbi:MAG TPA: PKD domain-containing protein [Thermoanaerobaculia bacterium]|nr:PKD domain-containing protein [Thermoanaerobaculia bacterium]